MSVDLSSAPVPPLRDDDHVRGPHGAPLVLFYADFTCPRCALLWVRCDELGLDTERFEADRRDPVVAERVTRDVREALRAGATSTPTLWADGADLVIATMERFGIREVRRIGPPTEGRARKGSPT